MALVHHLYELQRLDTELDALQRRLEEIRALLAFAAEVEAAREGLEAARRRTRERQRAFQEAEARTAQYRQKIQDIERRLAGGTVRNPRQVLVLQQELEYLRRKLDEAEEAAIAALLALEEAQAEEEAAARHLEAVRARRQEQEAAWNQEAERLRRRGETLQARRDALVAHLPQEVYAVYQNLRRQKAGLAVAPVEDNACSACGAVLSARRLQEAANLDVLTYCAQCGRILYAG